jgi:hypothetical protein
MAQSRKKQDYLDALEDPDLSKDRQLALELMARARLITAMGEELAPALDIMAEVTRQKAALQCINCDADIDRAAEFCDQFCQQEAKKVRYVRKAIVDGRIVQPDIQMAIGINLWMLTGDGYPDTERSLSQKQRDQIFERDNHTCRLCGKPADQIDHMNGNSSDPDDLRAVCGECNRKESLKNSQPTTPQQQEYLNEMFNDLAARVAASFPILLCDDYEHWRNCQPGIRAARRRLIQKK